MPRPRRTDSRKPVFSQLLSDRPQAAVPGTAPRNAAARPQAATPPRRRPPRRRSSHHRPTHHRPRLERLEARELMAGDVVNDLAHLNDEFDDPTTLAQWQRIHQVEGWNADQLEVYDIGQTHAGRLTMIPHTTTWYQDYRGPLAFKEVSGDFEVVTQVHIRDRDDVGGSDADEIPNDATFSLGGLMLRTPRNITNPAADWSPGSQLDDETNNGENFVFLSLGHGVDGNMTLEIKSTRNSHSDITLLPVNAQTAELRLSRLGDTVTTLYRLPGQTNWQLAQTFSRPDLPDTLQVGMVSYTNYEKVSGFAPFYHNGHVLSPQTIPAPEDPTPFEPFDPDLEASFDYVRFSRPAAAETNTRMDVGVNLEHIADWAPGMPFKDAFLKARPFQPMVLDPQIGYWTFQGLAGGGPDLQQDDRGWVTGLGSWLNGNGQTVQQGAQSVIFTPEARNPAGVYTLEWDGTGQMQLGNTPIVSQGTTPDGSHFAEFDLPADIFLSLLITQTDPADPIRNIDFWMPHPDGGSYAGENWNPTDPGSPSPFLPSFLESLQGVSAIRFMDWMHTNLTDIVSWDDRRAYDHATQSDGDAGAAGFNRGVAPEYIVALANELQVDIWVNMPAQADDGYVQNFATLVRDTLDPDLRVYVEYSNEIWNAQFAVNGWLAGLAASSGVGFFDAAAQQMQTDFALWSDVFAGQESRLTRVVGAQAANPYIATQLLARMDGQFDAVSPTAYAGIGETQVPQFDAGTTPAEIIQRLYDESIPWALDVMAQHATLADQYSVLLDREIQLLSYESGSHIFSHLTGMHVSPAVDAALAAHNDPEMYHVYTTLLEGMRNVGVDLYNEFTFTGNRQPLVWGAYGLIETHFDPVPTWQYQALFDFIAAQNASDPDPDPPAIELTAEGTLIVRGGPLDDVLVIQDLGNGNVSVQLSTPASGEQTGGSFAGVNRVQVQLDAGNDSVEYDAVHIASPVAELQLLLGEGDDQVRLTADLNGTAAAFAWNLDAEQVEWTLQELTIPLGQSAAIDATGVRTLRRTLRQVDVQGAFQETIVGTPEADQLRLFASQMAIGPAGSFASDVQTGEGNDRVAESWQAVHAQGSFSRQTDLGGGNDQFHEWQQLVTLAGSASAQVQGGEGNDRIFRIGLSVAVEPTGSYDVLTQGGGGRDHLLTLFSNADVRGRLQLHSAGGDGNDLIQLLAQARHTSTGSLTARVWGEAGDDRMILQVVPVPGLDEFFAEMNGGEGNDWGWQA